MQSSPPRGAFPRPLPSSPATSRYSLDLDAFGPSSDASSPVAERSIPRIMSEDIDGPTDFTINMMDWMKGRRALKRNNTDGGAAITTGTPSIFRTNEMDMQATVEDYSSPARPSNPTPLGGRTPTSERSNRGTTSRSSMLSPVQPHGGASQYLMGQIERLRSELAAEKEARAAERASHAAEVERMGAQHASKLQAATSELRATKEAHSTEIHRITAEYSQQLKATFEAAARDTEKLKASHAAEIERIKTQHEKDLKDAIHSSTTRNTTHTTEIKQLKAHHAEQMRAATDASNTHNVAHAAEMARLHTEHAQEKQTTTEHINRLNTSHATEIEQLKSQLKAATAASGKRSTSRNTEITRLKQQHAEEMQAARDATRALEVAHAKEMQNIIAEHKAVNAATDAAITEKVVKRETRYKEKVAARDAKLADRDAEIQDLYTKIERLEKKNNSLGKELMRAWGREEFGDTGEKQKYRYKYVKAGSVAA